MVIFNLLKKSSKSNKSSEKKKICQQDHNYHQALLNQGFSIVEKIAEGCFSLYRISTTSKAENKSYVLKDFPYQFRA